MAAARIVVVEDEPVIAGAVADRLRAAGYEVHIAGDGPAGVELVQRTSPDLVVLDVMLPGFDGHEVCRRIQAQRAVPVLMLTARSAEADLLAGLEVGADDYLAKPFSPRELVARVKNVLKRANGGRVDRHVLEVAGLTLNRKSREVVVNDTPVDLTQREFDLLAFLMEHPEEVITREVLLEHVWGYTFGDTSTVTVHVRRLREKIEPEPSTPTYVQTVWGVGYKFGG